MAYTTTTEQVRNAYVEHGTRLTYGLRAAEFDAWLESVKLAAFNEGYTAAESGACGPGRAPVSAPVVGDKP